MAATFRERVGERIRDARKAKGMTQAQVARLLPGTTHPTEVSRWERGKTLPQTPTLEALAKALDRDPSYFLVPGPENGSGSGDLLGVLANGVDENRVESLLAHQNENLARQSEILERLTAAQELIEARLSALAPLAEAMTGLATELADLRQELQGRRRAP